MEHSVKAYLKRVPTKKLELFLENCVKSDQGERYRDILPLIYEILSQRQNEQAQKKALGD